MSDTPKPVSQLPFKYEFDENEGIISNDNQKVASAHYMKRPSHLGRKDKNTVGKDFRYIVHACNSLPALEARVKELETALEMISNPHHWDICDGYYDNGLPVWRDEKITPQEIATRALRGQGRDPAGNELPKLKEQNERLIEALRTVQLTASTSTGKAQKELDFIHYFAGIALSKEACDE